MTKAITAMGLLLTLVTAFSAEAQYQEIPDYSGVGAGAQFRADINNHLSGVSPIAPRLVSLPFAQLPAEQDGQLYWCPDCQQVTPCAGGGAGAMVVGVKGQWTCQAGSGTGAPLGPAGNDLGGQYPNPIVNSVLGGKTPVTTQNGVNALSPASSSYSMGGNSLGHLAVDANTGDALSRGQSTLNSLTAPTANFNMAGQTLTNLGASAAGNQPLAFGQSGALLNGLNLNNFALTGVAPATVSGQALTYGQSGAQVASVQTPFVAGTATAQHTGTSLIIAVPTGAQPGTDVEIAVISHQNAGVVTSPSGWTNLRTDCSAGNCQRIDYHVTSVGDPANYTWTCSSTPTQFNGGIADVRNARTSSPIDASSGTNTTAATVSLAALPPTVAGDLALVAISGGAPLYVTGPPNGLKNLWLLDQAGNWGSLVESFPQFNMSGTSISAQYVATQGNTFDAAQILIAGAMGSGNVIATNTSNASVKSLRGNLADGSNTIDGYSLNGVVNVAAFGAVADGSADASGPIQTAINTACAASQSSNGLGVKPAIYVPQGTYLLLKPIILHCNTNGMRLLGAGKFNTALVMSENGVGTSYGTALLAEPTNAITSLNGAGIVAGSLESGPGHSLFWGSNSATFVLDLSQVTRSIALQPLNGLTALDVRGFLKLGQANTDTSGATYIFASDGKIDQSGCNTMSLGGAYSCKGAAQVFVDQNLELWAVMNVSGTNVAVHSATGAVALNTTHEVEAVFDGSNVCLFLDGARVATSTAAGTITQRPDEDMLIGEDAQVFPTAGGVGRAWFSAPVYLDSFEIRKAIPSGRSCAATSYTEDAAKFSGDNNSIILLNFDNLLDINGNVTTSAPALIGADRFNGIDMAPADGPSGQGAWIAVRNESLTSGEAVDVRDLGVGGATTGILAITSQGSQFDNLQLGGAYAGLYLTNYSFNNEESDIGFNSSGLAGFVATNGSGLTSARNFVINTPGCGWACLIDTGGGGVWDKLYTSPQSSTAWQVVLNNLGSSATSWDFINPTEDVENGGAAGGLLLEGVGTANIHGGGLASAGNSPLVTISTSGNPAYQAVDIHGTNLSIASGAPEVVNVTPGNMFGTVLFDASSFTAPPFVSPPNAIPWSNQANLVSVIGSEFTLPYATFPSGLQHLSVPQIQTPSAPTLSVVGSSGSNAYGPYYVVCHDWNGGLTYVSNASNTIANGPTALSAANYIAVAWNGNPACSSWDVLKGSATTAIGTGLPTGSVSFKDQGGASTVYAPPLRNNTGDITAGGLFVSSGINYTSIPSTVLNGGHFYCPDCDAPANPPTTCSSNASKSGSMVYGVHNQWVCAY